VSVEPGLTSTVTSVSPAALLIILAALIAPDSESADKIPCAVLLAVAIEGNTAHAIWIGGDVALVVLGCRVLGRTTPHTLRARMAREQPGPAR
jgi:hypothetical protein